MKLSRSACGAVISRALSDGADRPSALAPEPVVAGDESAPVVGGVADAVIGAVVAAAARSAAARTTAAEIGLDSTSDSVPDPTVADLGNPPGALSAAVVGVPPALSRAAMKAAAAAARQVLAQAESGAAIARQRAADGSAAIAARSAGPFLVPVDGGMRRRARAGRGRQIGVTFVLAALVGVYVARRRQRAVGESDAATGESLGHTSPDTRNLPTSHVAAVKVDPPDTDRPLDAGVVDTADRQGDGR